MTDEKGVKFLEGLIKRNFTPLFFEMILTQRYGYSIQTIDFIVEEIKKDPDNIIQNLRNLLTK